jgi:hypothetical protein
MDLTLLVPSLKRAVAPPGEFDTFYGEASEDELAASLCDAIAEAQLDGFFATLVYDVDALTVEPDPTQPQQALIVLYAMTRIMSARIANLKSRTRYKAGPVEAETEQAASVLVELLRQANDRKKQLLEDAKYGRLASSFAMVDLYITKSVDWNSADVHWSGSNHGLM